MRFLCFLLIILTFSCVTGPGEQEYGLHLANYYYSNGLVDDALEIYENLYQFHNLEAEYMYNYFILLLHTKRYDTIIAIVEKDFPNPKGYIAEFYAYALSVQELRRSEAMVILKDLNVNDPGDIELSIRYASLLIEFDNRDEAERVLASASVTGDLRILAFMLDNGFELEGEAIVNSFDTVDGMVVASLIRAEKEEMLRQIRESDVDGARALVVYFNRLDDTDQSILWLRRLLELGFSDVNDLNALLRELGSSNLKPYFAVLADYFNGPVFK